MANFWENPLKKFEKNKITFTDHVQKEHHQQRITERFKYSSSDQLYDQYRQMQAEIYVFSEKELKDLLNS